MKGLIGRKLGMTSIFNEDGLSVPVTVIQVEENRIVQVKSLNKNGYNAYQLSVGSKNINHITKAENGHFLKSGVLVGRRLCEFRIDNDEQFVIGQKIGITMFHGIKMVDITGVSKGKGFSGVIKRWNFRSQDSSHGNSLSHRAPGSIGQNQTPGRVFKGKKMAGQLGNHRVTIQNICIVSIDLQRSLLLVKGAVPGFSGSDVLIKLPVKYKNVRR